MLHSIINLIRDFIAFIKCPTDNEMNDYSKMFLLKTFLVLFVLDILIMVGLTALIDGFSKIGWIKIEEHQITLLLDLLPIWIVFILTVIVLPFIEEIIFRLPLRYKRNYFLRLLSYLFIGRKSDNSILIHEFWKNQYPIIFYLSIVVFALIHFFNYDLESTLIYLFPILILPQFVLGLFVGYLRVRFSFIYGFLLHAFHNSIFISIALLSLNDPINKLNIENNIFSIKIDEVNRTDTSSFDLHQDSIRFNGINLKTVILTLANKDEYLIDFEQNALLNRHISLTLKNKTNQSLNLDSITLDHLSRVYDFKLDSSKIKNKMYKLIVYDSLKLSKHSPKILTDTSRSTNSSTLMTFENVTLEVIARELSRNYKELFEITSKNDFHLFMKLPSNDIKQLENILKSDYGILLQQSEKEIEHINVKFKN